MIANGVEELEGLQCKIAQVGVSPGGACSLVQGGRSEPAVAPVLGNPRRDPVRGLRVVEAGAPVV
eukprot:5465858-Lingulodinium_polyedra.AAC.1